MVHFAIGSGDPYDGDDNIRVSASEVDKSGGNQAASSNLFFGDEDSQYKEDILWVNWIQMMEQFT